MTSAAKSNAAKPNNQIEKIRQYDGYSTVLGFVASRLAPQAVAPSTQPTKPNLIMEYRRVRLSGGTYFFTVVTHRRLPLFQDETTVDLLFQALRYVQKQHPFTIVAYAIMPDHLHMIWEMPENDFDYPTRWRLIKSYVTRGIQNRPAVINQSRKSKGEQEIWQRRYWEHTCKSQHDLDTHIDYIHYNPVKHGLTNSPDGWIYSSFAQYVREGLYSPQDPCVSIYPDFMDESYE